MHNPCVVSCGVQCIVPNDAEQVGKLNISAGITPEAGTLPLKLSLGGTPTGFIDIAQGRAIKLSISGGILTVPLDRRSRISSHRRSDRPSSERPAYNAAGKRAPILA